MTAFTSRCVYYLPGEDMEIGGLSDFNYCWHVGGGRNGVRGAAPVGSRGEAPARVWGAEPPNCHATNLKCFMNKFCHEMRHDL